VAATTGSRCRQRALLDGGPAMAACEGNKNWEGIQAERRGLNLYSNVSVVVPNGPAVEACISIAVHR
jgi:hypothetical protein